MARPHATFFAFVLALAAFAAPLSCGTTSTTAKPKTLCTAQQEVYCRCQNFDEGTKVCADDGQSFGPCLPCDGDTQLPDPDSGSAVSVDSGDNDAGVEGDAADASSPCGNAKIETGEACDDGNKVEDDGCNTMCLPQGGYPMKAGICPGMAIHLWGTTPLAFAGTTNLFPLTYRAKAACGGSTGTTGSDRVYAITPHTAGMLEAKTSNATFDQLLYARSDCATEASELGCANAVSGSGGETLTFAVVSGTTYYLVVDGATNTTGNFTLTLTVK
jgi:cysteine-rich repeat protein